MIFFSNTNYWRTNRHSYTYGTSTYAIYNMTKKTNISWREMILITKFTKFITNSLPNLWNSPFMSLWIMSRECKKHTPSNICIVYTFDKYSGRTPSLLIWLDNEPCRKLKYKTEWDSFMCFWAFVILNIWNLNLTGTK